MPRNKKLKRIGWVPYCVGGGTRSLLGFWKDHLLLNKGQLMRHLKDDAPGLKFKIVPVYAAIPKP